MKRPLLILFLLLAVSIFVVQPAQAIYGPLSVPNNRIGIHLLDPNEIDRASELVNSSGGDWGYVTVPIRANDRNLTTWKEFMEKAKKLHLIPILRIATFGDQDHWVAPNEWDLVDFANFLDDLPWPTKNRYVVVYNEPNHNNEWGGFVYPEEYARVLSRAVDIFHQKNQDYFMISAGMDSSAPNSWDSMNIYSYFERMEETVPGVLSRVDGWSFHSYGNPAFDTKPNLYSSVNINGFRTEVAFLRNRFGVSLPIFLTEVGWRRDLVGDQETGNYYTFALNQVWTNDVVAVTPFILSSTGEPFGGFSFLKPDGSYFQVAKDYQSFPKTIGSPILSDSPKLTVAKPPISISLDKGSNLTSNIFSSFDNLILALKSFFK